MDPMELSSSDFSPYNFVENNPMNLVDPDGMQSNSPDFSYGASTPTQIPNDWNFNLKPTGSFNAPTGGFWGAAGHVATAANAVLSFVNSLYAFSGKVTTVQNFSTLNKVQGNVVTPVSPTVQTGSTNNNGIFGNAKQGECPTCVIPSTVGRNIGGDNYTGGNNPMNYNGTYNYSMPLMSLTDGPSLGHDRRYDRLGAAGPHAVFTDTRASIIDLRFVGEQFGIVLNPRSDDVSRGKSFIAGLGILFYSAPKMINQSITNPASWRSSLLWYQVSNIGVNNIPNK